MVSDTGESGAKRKQCGRFAEYATMGTGISNGNKKGQSTIETYG
jgi:hypothetical protein